MRNNQVGPDHEWESVHGTHEATSDSENPARIYEEMEKYRRERREKDGENIKIVGEGLPYESATLLFEAVL